MGSKRVIIAAAALLVSSFVVGRQPSLAVSPLEGGIKLFNKQDFNSASGVLEAAVKSDPYNQNAQYYLACTLLKLGKLRPAASHFQAAFQIEPLSAAGQYSRQALLSLGPTLAATPEQDQKVDKDKVLPDDPKSLIQAVKFIRAQALERNNLNKAAGTRHATLADANGQIQESLIQKRAALAVADLTAGNVDGRYNTEIEETKQKATFAAQRARFDAQQQSQRYMKIACERQTLVERSAADLLALINEDPQPGHVKLKAGGSNLYVRNYGTEPLPTPVPMRAEWQLLPQAKEKAEREAQQAKTKQAKMPVIASARQTSKKSPGSGSERQTSAELYGRVLF